MNIDTLNANKMVISLTDEEVSSIFGGYDKIDYSSPHSKIRFNSFLNSIILSENFSLDSKSLMVEIRQEVYGCSITLTKIYDKIRKRHRLKIRGRLAIFNDSNEMIEGIISLYKSNIRIKKSSLYLLGNQYRLLIYTATADELISEYLQNITKDKTAVSYTEEHGTSICLGNAVSMLGKIFA